MSRQDRQADLRRRMAEARSKLQVAGGSQTDREKQTNAKVPLPPSSSGILRKPKYAPTNVDGDQPSKKSANNDNSSGRNALGGLIGGYSSSDDEGVDCKPAAQESTKKRDALLSPRSLNGEDGTVRKRAKFSDDVHVRTITSDEDGKSFQAPEPAADNFVVQKPVAKLDPAKSKSTEDKISQDVWDEFNALLGDDPATIASGGNSEILSGETIDTNLIPNQDASSAAASPSETTKVKKKKKKKKQSPDKSYDNETLTNAEQASYEARLARLMLLKSRRQKHKTESSDAQDDKLASLDFYDPSLAFHEDDEDDSEPNVSDNDSGYGMAAAADASIEKSGNTSQSASNATFATFNSSSHAPRISISNILRKRRDEARLLSTRSGGGQSSKQEDVDSANDGRWF